MRKKFSELLHGEMALNENVVLITADLGYGLWDKIKIDYPDRFYNTMSCEQLMLGMAVGLAMEGKLPVCYSITPFLLLRPFEWIRNYLQNEEVIVKLVGGGRDRDYGYLGSSHWCEEDLQILAPFNNIGKHKPQKLTEPIFKSFLYEESPSYINICK